MADNDGKGFAWKLDGFVIFLMQGRFDLWCVTKRAVTRCDAWRDLVLIPLPPELRDKWP